MTRLLLGSICTLAVAAVLGTSGVASAGIADCGNIDVEANAMCEVEVEGGCTAHCTPVSFEAACAGKLEASCTGMCNGSFEASCKTDCQADCTGRCDVNPGMFDCNVDCNA